jgi:hypothetical protein
MARERQKFLARLSCFALIFRFMDQTLRAQTMMGEGMIL